MSKRFRFESDLRPYQFEVAKSHLVHL